MDHLIEPGGHLDLRYEQFIHHLEARERASRPEAERIAGRVLEALRLRLSAGASDDLEAELPLQLRRVLRRLDARGHAQRHRGMHDNPRITDAEFLQAVAGRLRLPLERAASVSASVFEALRLVLPPKEIVHVASQLSADLRQRWLGRAAPAPIQLQPPPELPYPGPEGSDVFMAELRASGALGEVEGPRATRAVLGALLARLSSAEAHRLVDELPDGIRDLVADVMPARHAPITHLRLTALVKRVASELEVDERQARAIVRSVIAATRLHCSDGEVARISTQLTGDLKTVWDHPFEH